MHRKQKTFFSFMCETKTKKEKKTFYSKGNPEIIIILHTCTKLLCIFMSTFCCFFKLEYFVFGLRTHLLNMGREAEGGKKEEEERN